MALPREFDRCLHNLRTVAAIGNNQRLTTIGEDTLAVERNFSFLRPPRARFIVLTVIRNTLYRCDDFIVNYRYVHSNAPQHVRKDLVNHILQLKDVLPNFLSGLDTITRFEKYQSDVDFKVIMDGLVIQYKELGARVNDLLLEFGCSEPTEDKEEA